MRQSAELHEIERRATVKKERHQAGLAVVEVEEAAAE